MKRQLQCVTIVVLLLQTLLVAQDTTCSTHQGTRTQCSRPRSSKDDVDAIGHRQVGKRGFGNWYSLEGEIALGKEYAQSVESEVTIFRDPMVNELVNRLAQTLARNSDAQIPIKVRVIDSEEVNAFSLPGGYLYVNTGIILASDNEAELAGIMAHEIAHIAARHATRQMTRSDLFSLVSLPLSLVGGGAVFGIVRAVTAVGRPITMLKFSRSFESEADYLGLEYLYAAGYDPHAFISFLERLGVDGKKRPGAFAMLFATHPRTSDRLKKGQKEISKILPARESYLVNTSDFDNVKARLLRIQNAEREAEQQQTGVPTLRRRPISTGGSNLQR